MENKEKAISQDIIGFFDSLICKGVLQEDIKLVEGLNVTLKVLNTGELLAAEAEATTNHPLFPMDIVNRGRVVSVLSKATVAINGVDIEQSSLSKEENALRRNTLYSKYMALPPELVDKAHIFYKELQEKQNKTFTQPTEDIVKEVENF